MKIKKSRPDRRIMLALIILITACCHTAAAQSATSTTTTTPSSGGSDLEQSGFTKATCTCKCNEKNISAVGILKAGTWEKIISVEQNTAAGKCQEQCAKTCGGRTTCANQSDSDCSTRCDTFCTSSYSGEAGTSTAAGKTPTDLCKTSCKSTCKFKGTINGITGIIYMIAGMLGALMIAIHGIRMVTSQEPHDRDAAKSSILHVTIALIIIAMASALVNMFITMGGLEI